MSAPKDLQDLDTGELKDLWSANDKMLKALKRIKPKCTAPNLKAMFTETIGAIETHTVVLKEMISESGEQVAKPHCRGMEGLVAEATRHTVTEAPDEGPVLDAVAIAQYQRMTHYAIAGFGTAASYAGTLGLHDDKTKLDPVTSVLYRSDQYMTQLAEMSVNIEAQGS